MTTFIKSKPLKLNIKQGVIEMVHGSGGHATHHLLKNLFLPAFSNQWLEQRHDSVAVALPAGQLVVTTDAHVITPIFFPGGDIGSLAVNGTINDLAMSGAKPLYLTASFILEAGLSLTDLQNVVVSMATSAAAANVAIVAGDIKVVEKGKGDGIFITTTGVGVIETQYRIDYQKICPGDKVLINGPIGDHGITILAKRNHLEFQTELKSDTVALHDLVATMLAAVPDIHWLRDPTRGGLGTALNELADQAKIGIVLDECQIPIRQPVRGACELLGIDPLYVANEGKLIAICKAAFADQLLATMRSHSLGKQAAIIGEIISDPYHLVQLKTEFGGTRIVDWLQGEQLPRIC